MVDQAANDGVQALLATNLRRLRIARHLSLSELARATRMSKATLSSIENGRANPTVETLATLAQALRIGLTELLEELPLAEVRIVRASSGGFELREGISRRCIDQVSGPEVGVEVSEVKLPPSHSREASPQARGSRRHVFVLSGKLIAGPVERSTELGPGDYMSFPADVPHVYETGRQPARALLLSEAPGRP
jgi:transcriptional regulator with XRE-family HTH domain